MDYTGEFAARYRREYDYYDQAARLSAQKLDGLIQSAGIRAIVSARAKNPARLESKAKQRNSRKPYTSVDDVYNDIVDLAGVRIALYFPGDRSEVDRIVKANVDLLEEPKVFPSGGSPSYKKRFSGYWATHYRFRLREKDLSDSQKRYAEARVELQVASVLMHAWSEVEHDLVYKPFSGQLSEDEYAILDELNGLVLTGEIALERLQRAIEYRVAKGDRKFSSHYDLAAHLFEIARPILENAPSEAALGRIDLLFQLLERLNLDTPNALSQFVQFLDSDTERRPIADQIIDQIIAEDKDRYTIYSEIRNASEHESMLAVTGTKAASQQAAGHFLQSWIGFERLVSSLIPVSNSKHHYPVRISPYVLQSLGLTDPVFIADIDRIRKLRNNFVHGMEEPDDETLRMAAKRLDEISAILSNTEISSMGKGGDLTHGPSDQESKSQTVGVTNSVDVGTAPSAIDEFADPGQTDAH